MFVKKIYVQSTLGEEARKICKETEQKLAQMTVNLGKEYTELVTGRKCKSIHHSHQGRFAN